MATAPDARLSESEQQDLRRLAGIMVPADEADRMPGADDPAIVADLVASLGRDTADVRETLARLNALSGRPFGQLAAPEAEAVAMALLGCRDHAVLTLGRVVLAAYYRDGRVMQALGREARAPFPKGHVLPEGDWSLLEAVKARPPLWRDDRRG